MAGDAALVNKIGLLLFGELDTDSGRASMKWRIMPR
jgi:hypothetical protein